MFYYDSKLDAAHANYLVVNSKTDELCVACSNVLPCLIFIFMCIKPKLILINFSTPFCIADTAGVNRLVGLFLFKINYCSNGLEAEKRTARA